MERSLFLLLIFSQRWLWYSATVCQGSPQVHRSGRFFFHGFCSRFLSAARAHTPGRVKARLPQVFLFGVVVVRVCLFVCGCEILKESL